VRSAKAKLWQSKLRFDTPVSSTPAIDEAGSQKGVIHHDGTLLTTQIPLPSHQLITPLKSLRGTARACVYTEPLFGIPYNYVPYASIYMLAFGLTDSQIGLITSIGLAVQIFWTVMSGALTDKFGCRGLPFALNIILLSLAGLLTYLAR
jgi:hypothetical protein